MQTDGAPRYQPSGSPFGVASGAPSVTRWFAFRRIIAVMNTVNVARLRLVVLLAALGCSGTARKSTPTPDAGSERVVEPGSRSDANNLDLGDLNDSGGSGGISTAGSAGFSGLAGSGGSQGTAGSGGIDSRGGSGGIATPTPDAGSERVVEPGFRVDADTRELGEIDGSGGSGGISRTGGSGGIGGSGGSGGIRSTASSSGCATMCFVDFPCGYYGNDVQKCVLDKPNSILSGHNVSCQEVCGTPCCSGGGCRTAVEDCPVGTVCAYPAATPTPSSTYVAAACVPQAQTCGGSQNSPCPTGQYCEHFGLLCEESGYCPDNLSACGYVNSGGLGTCRPLPTSAQCSGQTEAVCGCDGVTYANDCARISANAAWASPGACRPASTDAGRDAANLPDVPQSRDLRAEATSDLGYPETYSDSAGGLAGEAGMADAPASP